MRKLILLVLFLAGTGGVFCQTTFTVNIKAWLEGPFDNSQMSSALLASGSIPLSQPYNQPPWNYDGIESVAAIPAGVVDWILVDLRLAGNASTAYQEQRVARQAGFILTGGTVVSIDGVNPMQFSAELDNKLYVVLCHRNHLAVISANELIANGDSYFYDFTTHAGQAYGCLLAQKELAPGAWGLFAGDGDANGQVSNVDKNMVWFPQAGSNGYLAGDFNLDGDVNNIDKIGFWSCNSGTSAQVPVSWHCGLPMERTHAGGEVSPVNKNVIYGTVETSLSGSEKCWITQNLGSDHQAVSAFDTSEEAAGWYWQFNRRQGYKQDGTTITPAWMVTYIDQNSDWQAINDPCLLLLGAGWRIPVYSEWYNAHVIGGWNNYYDPFASVLKLHTSGLLFYSDGSIILRGVAGDFWSGTQFNSLYGYGLGFGSVSCGVGFSAKAYGFALRCLND